MENITISKNISFCFGVQRTISLIERLLLEKKYRNIYMLGEVVHNEHVIRELTQRGLKLIRDINRIPVIKDGIVIVQSHGISPKIYRTLARRRIPYIDSTCLLVRSIHTAIKKLDTEGYFPVIIGNPRHTEVIGIAGHAKKTLIIRNKKEVKASLFRGIKRAGVVFQSTSIQENAQKILDKIRKKVPEVKVIDTICRPTKSRQQEIRENAKKYKCLMVIGSRTSANTNHLYNIARSRNRNTFLIEKPEDVHRLRIRRFFPCFVTSGASTPRSVIDRTIRMLTAPFSDLARFSEKWAPAVDQTMRSLLKGENTELRWLPASRLTRELVRYSLRPGKRLRPLLFILACLGFSRNRKKLSRRDMLILAAGIELMHNFLLIHDDIMDRADIRRGGKSFHRLCAEMFTDTHNPHIGEDIALVSGDILFARVLSFISRTRIADMPRFLRHFSSCYELTGWGQVMDSVSSQPVQLPRDKGLSLNISRYKTAYYTLYYPLVLGYTAAGGRDPAVLKKIKEFSIPLGISFQIRDDILGVFGDSFRTGKSDISDIIEGKFTLLISQALELMSPLQKKEFAALYTQKDKTADDAARIKALIKRSGAVEKNMEEIERYCRRSALALRALPAGKEQKAVLADMIERMKQLY